MDVVAATKDANLEPYLAAQIASARRKARRNGVFLFGAIVLLAGVILLLIGNFAPGLLGIQPIVLPFGLDGIIPQETRNSVLFGAAAPLVTASGQFIDRIASARRERLTLIYTRYLLAIGEREQASKVLLLTAMGNSKSDNSDLIEYLAFSGN